MKKVKKFRSPNSAAKVIKRYLRNLEKYQEEAIDYDEITFGSAIFEGAEPEVYIAKRFLKEYFGYNWQDPISYCIEQ